MTAAMDRRVAALESRNPLELSPAAKAWLGMPLTAAEREQLANEPASPPRDLSLEGLSPEAVAWLTWRPKD